MRKEAENIYVDFMELEKTWQGWQRSAMEYLQMFDGGKLLNGI